MRDSLKLKEIVWEILGKCNNDCRYCGSKEIRNAQIDVLGIYRICDEICKYPPESINITGGDPLLLPLVVHTTIVQKLKEKKVEVKLIVNPKSFDNSKDVRDFLDLYDVVGISINDEQDINLYNKKFIPFKSKYVFITNFNLYNIFDYKAIEDLVYKYKAKWVIQYTMYKEENDRAIYTCPSAVKTLFNLMNSSINRGVQLIPSDNISNGPCTAGLTSIGILYTGAVVPCLSMRAWFNTHQIPTEGQIIEMGLKTIWEKGFREARFNDFFCCKDHCKNKCFGTAVLYQPDKQDETKEDYPVTPIEEPVKLPRYPKPHEVKVYGVPSPTIDKEPWADMGRTYVYGVPSRFDSTSTGTIKDGPINIMSKYKKGGPLDIEKDNPTIC